MVGYISSCFRDECRTVASYVFERPGDLRQPKTPSLPHAGKRLVIPTSHPSIASSSTNSKLLRPTLPSGPYDHRSLSRMQTTAADALILWHSGTWKPIPRLLTNSCLAAKDVETSYIFNHTYWNFCTRYTRPFPPISVLIHQMHAIN